MKSLFNKYLKLIITSFLLLLVISTTFKEETDAAYFAAGRKNNASPYVYYDSSVSSYAYASNFDAARAYWNANSLVNITKTSSTSTRPDVYYVSTTSKPGYYGQTYVYGTNGMETSTSSYWEYAEVFVFDNQVRANSSNSSAIKNYNVAHEIGHTIKMAHVPIPYNSVMIQGLYSIPSSITSFDSGELNAKW